jgi:hypothetical protein
MRILFLVFLIASSCYYQTDASKSFSDWLNNAANGASNFFNGASNLISNGVNGAVNLINNGIEGANNAVNNLVTNVSNTIDVINFVGTFLWDNALNPSLTTLQQSENIFSLFLDTNLSNFNFKRYCYLDKHTFWQTRLDHAINTSKLYSLKQNKLEFL